jgi:hypothetical protein
MFHPLRAFIPLILLSSGHPYAANPRELALFYFFSTHVSVCFIA